MYSVVNGKLIVDQPDVVVDVVNGKRVVVTPDLVEVVNGKRVVSAPAPTVDVEMLTRPDVQGDRR